MAKRKRLTPAKDQFLSQTDGLETKSAILPSAPIAQVAAEASATAALSELSQMVSTARSEGRFIQAIDLDDINEAYLVRDRIAVDEDELGVLAASLKDRGQQTPIEVVDLGADMTPRYGLISGWRRLSALRRLRKSGEELTQIQALIRAPETSSDAYVAMVEENEIRVGVSFYERARIVVKAVEQGVYADDKTALNQLFKNVTRAKRSKIKSFMTIVRRLDEVLLFPTQIGERFGLRLVAMLNDDATLADNVKKGLLEQPPANAAIEQAIIGRLLSTPSTQPAPDAPDLQYDAKKRRIVISGAHVTPALHKELKAWLKTRMS